MALILGSESSCARCRAQCDGHVHIGISEQTTCIQFRASWNWLLSRRAPRARLHGSASRGASSSARARPHAVTCHITACDLLAAAAKNNVLKHMCHLKTKISLHGARLCTGGWGARVTQRPRNFRALAALPRPLALTAPPQRSRQCECEVVFRE